MRNIIQILGAIVPFAACLIWPSFIMGLLPSWLSLLIFLCVWALWILVAQKVFEFAYLDWIVPMSLLLGRIAVYIFY